jgi:ketosteroid isomerase-like protein
MSQENLTIVRRFVVGDLEQALAYAAPDIVWDPVEEASGRGHDAVRASLARWKDTWDEYEVTHEEFVDAGDRVVVTLQLRGRGRGSGVEIDARFFDVYTIRDGKIVRMDEFTERSAALEAAGLRE